MRFFTAFSAFAALAISHVAVASPVYQDLQLRQGGDVNALLQGLRDQNLTALADVLKAHPDVTDKILADDTPKYFLAPDNDAIAGLPAWVTGNSSRLEATLLQHVLRGDFDPSAFNTYPLHTIGHSLLNSEEFVQLPGGAGQAVALAQSGSKTFIAEAINNGTLISGGTTKYENVTIQPIARAITVPGSMTETLEFLGHTSFSKLLKTDAYSNFAQKLDSNAGSTLFVPTEAAIAAFVKAYPDANSVVTNQIFTVLGQHIVQSRVVYSPLLIDQQSMISASGQDIVFDNTAGSVRVGNFTAKILQTDIIAQQGVIHLIDAVLASTALDAGRADAARESALSSYDSALSQAFSGPVSGTNAITTQGTDVPVSQDGADTNQQATANGDSSGTGVSTSGIGNGTDGQGGGTSYATSSVSASSTSDGSSSSGGASASGDANSTAGSSPSASAGADSASGTSTKKSSGKAGSSTSSAARSQFTSSSNGAGVNIGTGLDHRNENAALGTSHHVSAATGVIIAAASLFALLN